MSISKKGTKMNKIVNIYLMALVVLVLVVGKGLLYSDIKVYPRLVTPGAAFSNDNVFFEFEDYSEPKPVLTIFDLTGRIVKSFQVIDPIAVSTGWRLVWDGKDEGGNLVFPGVYIYEWREATTTTTGAIVVAR